MRALFYTVVARIRDFFRPAASDADFDQELDLHLAISEEDKLRRGMSPEQARREARLELGGAAQLREAARAARGLPWLETFWLDAKLGLRMLRRSWGLTLVGGLAMAVTIGLGASMFTIWDTFAGTRLPLHEGDRVVAIQPFDKAAQRVHRETPLPDFRRWRETLTSVEHVSAMRLIIPAVIARDGADDSVAAAEMTASGFQLARVRPLLGRALIEDDEREGADPVAVIGYQLWKEAFSADPAVLGQRLQIGDTPHVVVGVMPEGFRFPMNQRLWTPLRTNPVGEERPGSADAFIFARLAPGVTLERAQAEVTTFGLLRGDKDSAAGTAARREPRVVPYAAGMLPTVNRNRWLAGVIFLVGALLLIPPCANIAILVYARTVTRRDEFAARTALGASRGRIVMQLFVEVLVLAAGAGIAGLLLARQFSGRLAGIVMPAMGPLPFWMDFKPSLATVLCVAGLSVLAAAIAGAVPAFRVTGRWGQAGFAGLGNRAAGPRLGKTWTALLATQVALSLAILPSAMEMLWGVFRPTIVGPGLPVEEFLTASLVMEGDTSRFDNLRIEAVRRLTSEAGISGVTVSAAALFDEPDAEVEVEGREAHDAEAHVNSVDEKFFEVYGARFLAGRSFDASDFGPGRTPVIVNRSFVTEVLGDPLSPRLQGTSANALGRRIRYRETTQLARRSVQREGGTRQTAPSAWYEIVGVVENFPRSHDDPTMFHPMTGAPHPVSLTIRAPAGIGLAADRLREVASRLHPQLRVGHLESLDEMYWQQRSFDHMFGFMLGAVTLIVLLFSMAGIYTLTAFIVAQRWREIGVRAALGAQPRHLLIGIFGRAAVPLLIGAMAGCAIALRLHSFLSIAEVGGRSIPGIVPASAALMIVVGLLAVAGPARRAIRIDPVEALRVG
jgi:predicted permease